jgi:hypothetical protein
MHAFALIPLSLALSLTAAPAALSPAVPVVAPAATAFSLRDVHLLDGPLKHSQDIAAAYLLSLEPDRLLARFRQEAGLEKKAENYPGWEEKELPGVALGFYLSGCSKLWATSASGIGSNTAWGNWPHASRPTGTAISSPRATARRSSPRLRRVTYVWAGAGC